MSWFTNLPTRTKLTLGFGVLLFILLLIVVTAFYAVRAVHDAEQSVAEVMELRSGLNGQRASILAALLQNGPQREMRLREVKENSARNDELLRGILSGYGNDPELGDHVRQLNSIREELVKTRDNELIPMIRAGKEMEAREMVMTLQQERFDKIRSHAVVFADALDQRASKRQRQTNWALGILSVLAAALSITMIRGLTRSIARPLEEITAVADQIARGDLNASFSGTNRTDEVGLLAQTFQNMTRSLSGVAERARQIAAGDLTAQIKPQSEQDVLGTAFATMTKNLRGIIQELVEAVNVLAQTASQITASTAQLAASASETAAAVSETTTTVEEVKQTSQVSSQKAKYVSERAHIAADVSQAGKRSVDDAIEGMSRIRQQMESVAESILSLSTQGHAIGEIIATVDDLAAQSKLLAVNASIQAAKAGDEGKGFAVVAQEVKSLAEQSRQATTQVRGILNEIQNATSRAVLATEQGSKAVDAGVTRSTAAGDSISALNESIAEAAQAATQIAATSQQQFVGMDQVALAMENIRSASTQTVASTRQAEAAAQQMHELGQKLKKIAERFKV